MTPCAKSFAKESGNKADPSAAIIDSQSVKTDEQASSKGYDAGKKVKGRKRHILVDTLGLLLKAKVLTAEVQDRDATLVIFRNQRANAASATNLGRRRLSRQTHRMGCRSMFMDTGNCQKKRFIEDVHSASETLDRRANLFVVESKSAIE